MLFSFCRIIEIIDGEIVEPIAVILYYVLESAAYIIAIMSIFVVQHVVDTIELAVGGVLVLPDRLDNLVPIVVGLAVLFPLLGDLVVVALLYESAELVVGVSVLELARAVYHRRQLAVGGVIVANIVVGVRRHSAEGIIGEVIGCGAGSDACPPPCTDKLCRGGEIKINHLI